jgi:hypothetical protein
LHQQISNLKHRNFPVATLSRKSFICVKGA